MKPIDYALIGDGATERALIPILAWSLRTLAPRENFSFQGFVGRGGRDLGSTIDEAIRKYKPSLLFLHRDAERLSVAQRRAEIPVRDDVVAVVPVRMTEAWLLIDARAIREASGNRNGDEALELPRPRNIEGLSNPKKDLQDLLLRAAAPLGQRRRKRFELEHPQMVQRLAECIHDFGPLRELPAFALFWRDTESALERIAATRRASQS